MAGNLQQNLLLIILCELAPKPIIKKYKAAVTTSGIQSQNVKFWLYLKVDPYDSGSWKVLQNTTRLPVVKPGVLINSVFHWIGPLFVSEKKVILKLDVETEQSAPYGFRKTVFRN
ncbi:hypothetical protein Peur_012717 [Populus x canadensis]